MKNESGGVASECETEMETALLQALLVEENRMPDVAGWLKPEMFESEELGFIYSALLAQYERGVQPDLLTTENEMRRMDRARCEQMNGVQPVTATIHRMRHAGNLQEYAQAVKEKWLLRSLRAGFQLLSGKASGGTYESQILLREADKMLLDIHSGLPSGQAVRPVNELIGEAVELHRKRASGEGQPILTGLDELDAILLGFQNGELIVGAGRPSDGKTAVALQIAMNAARNGVNTVMFSLEMSNIQLMNRLFAAYASMDPDRLRMSDLAEEDFENIRRLQEEWKDLPLHIDFTPNNTVQNIRAQVLLQARKQKYGLIVVDYLNLIPTERMRNENLDYLIGQNITALKSLALEADCPVLVISQMNRNVEHRSDKGHAPTLSDLRDSGVIEQAADVVFFVQRPERYGITKDPVTGESLEKVGYIYVRKNRNGGVGLARFRFNPSFTLLSNYNNNLF